MMNKFSEFFVLLGVATVATAIVVRPESAKIVSSLFHGFAEAELAAEGNAAGFQKK